MFSSFRYKWTIHKQVFSIKMSNTGGRRLKQWLVEQIQSAQYSGLQWEDESRTLFRIPWKHAGKQDYNQEVDASIFKVWQHARVVLWTDDCRWSFVFTQSCA